ncbi:AAA domain-containing protein [candidate division KSB3 bacterium]|uniref:AAA domain-containing protein n=1 Tax=candidate division KSB3 bacterium TaxID=2044937 RepID=A0A9D5Q6Y0_9BACT|nr:AAA domain-containing protein [candidate division KSB3 bacterium]
MKLRQKLRTQEHFGSLIGGSLPMQEVYDQMKKAAVVDIPLLLEGETGSGKDLAAQTIHQLSDRHHGPYIPINLGALPTDLVAGELFGHEKGAFTGAVGLRKGRFEEARNGSIFLDEIEAVDEKIQVTLLRLIENRKFYRLGGKRRMTTNARLLAASNQSLEKLVHNGSFREDLYYRLNIFPITMPPLRDHKEDLPLLISHCVLQAMRMMKKQITEIDQECITILQDYSWPGNVRELKNVMQQSVLMCDGPTILPEHLPARFHDSVVSTVPVVSFKIGTPLEKIEQAMILRTLELTENNRTEAAKLLGISRRALYNRLTKYNIE